MFLKILIFAYYPYENEYFVKESHLLNDEYKLYKNLSNCRTKYDLNNIRKHSKYKKKGYNGHPTNYLFKYPLDSIILLSPVLNISIIFLLIFIHCRPDEFLERMVFRKSINSTQDYCVIFITSKSNDYTTNNKIKHESIIYKDILQFNEISSYFNLSIQTVHMLLWSCKVDFKYLLKSDIDVFININFIIKWLKEYISVNSILAIGKISDTYVIRDKKYSHYVPFEIVKNNKYPPYLQGVGYIIPVNTVKLLSRNIENVNPKIWIEDVFMGYLFCYTNTTLIDISSYIIRDLPQNISTIIHNAGKYMFIHGFYPIEIHLLHSIITYKQ